MAKVLLLCPEFSSYSFWNYKDVCKLMGAKYPSPPLGMITVAALLPEDWELKLIDMNTKELKDSDILWADLVFIGGMLPQQDAFIELIDKIHELDRKVVAGGADPTSQPDMYTKADYLVLGEAERSIVPFLEDYKNGVEGGVYKCEERPDMSETPIPRFDLLNFDDYMGMAIQYSRGCPFNCEFCDIIELFGRKHRAKSSAQMIKEFEYLYNLGYRGDINIVDDNFIGNRSRVKAFLLDIKEWLVAHNNPFCFSTEVSINVADDDELLSLMRDVNFKHVFIGIESGDENVVKSAQKKQNLNRKIADNVDKIYSYGIAVTGGFIIGFDEESPKSADMMIDIIKDSNIWMAMVGLLYALPNTQLTRRLEKEKRLFNSSKVVGKKDIDQSSSGINFITKRPRADVLKDYLNVIENIYSTKNYFDRCLRLSKKVKTVATYKPTFKMKIKYTFAFVKLFFKLGIKPKTFYYYWRNIFNIIFTKVSHIESVISFMAMFIHLNKQTKYIQNVIKENIEQINKMGEANFNELNKIKA